MSAADPHLEPTVARLWAEIETRRDELVATVADLVRIPSLLGDEAPVQAYVADHLRASGLATEVWEIDEGIKALPNAGDSGVPFAGRPNVDGVLSGQGGGRSLILNGHVDVVSPEPVEAWSHDPWGAEIAGDRMYGRGACDMKSGVAINLFLPRLLRDLGVRLRGDLIVHSVIEEECTGNGALAASLRRRADAALITEPTRLALVPAQGGSLVFRLTVTGRSAHAAVRDEGVSALEKFLPIFEDLRALESERNETLSHPLYERRRNKVPINVGVVRAGNWASTVPESLVAEGRIGLIPGEEVEPFRELVKERISAVAYRDPWLKENPPLLEWFGGQFAPAEVPPDAPICDAVKLAHELVTGEKPPVEGVPYGADMRLFIRFGGMPCIMYGAGDVNVAHAPDEHVSITELLTATKTVACLLVDWCG